MVLPAHGLQRALLTDISFSVTSLKSVPMVAPRCKAFDFQVRDCRVRPQILSAKKTKASEMHRTLSGPELQYFEVCPADAADAVKALTAPVRQRKKYAGLYGLLDKK